MTSFICRRISSALKTNYTRFHTFKRHYSYEGDGKTTVTILNHEVDSPLMIDSYSRTGFRLNNGMSVVGPLALFPKSALGWDVSSAADITPESLSAFMILEPKIEILVIGVGDHGQQVSSETKKFIQKKGINLEILPTEHACTTFNFLNVEKRYVAAALIPPTFQKLGQNEEAVEARIKLKKERNIL